MKTRNFMPNLENEKKGFFFIVLTFALAATLAAFEWGTTYNPQKELPGLQIDEAIFTEEAPICIIQKIKEKVATSKQKKAMAKINVSEKIAVVDNNIIPDEKTDFLIADIKPVYFPEEQFTDERENVFIPVEQMPQFPGGETELFKFLKNNVNYPKMSKELGITGTVFVEFIVNTDGTMADIKIAKGVSSDIDKEALRIVGSMPRWIPGSQRNKPVSVGMRLPIRFTLM